MWKGWRGKASGVRTDLLLGNELLSHELLLELLLLQALHRRLQVFARSQQQKTFLAMKIAANTQAHLLTGSEVP